MLGMLFLMLLGFGIGLAVHTLTVALFTPPVPRQPVGAEPTAAELEHLDKMMLLLRREKARTFAADIQGQCQRGEISEDFYLDAISELVAAGLLTGPEPITFTSHTHDEAQETPAGAKLQTRWQRA